MLQMDTRDQPDSPVTKYTPPHQRNSDEPMTGSSPSSPQSSVQPTPQSSPSKKPTQHQLDGSPKLSARGNPLWADIEDDIDQPATQSRYVSTYSSPPPFTTVQPRYSKYEALSSQQLNELKGKKAMAETEQPTARDSAILGLRSKHRTPVDVPADSQHKNDYRFRNRSESTVTSHYTMSQNDMPEPSTKSYTRRHPGNPVDDPQIVRQLENFHITTQHNQLIASVAKTFQSNEAVWERQPHVTISMDDEITGDYIQELVDGAMLFYFNDRPPSLHGFKAWVDCEFNLKRGWAFEQVRNLGRNFFLVKFIKASNRDQAVEEGPWYMG
jgi:hypothetical protein